MRTCPSTVRARHPAVVALSDRTEEIGTSAPNSNGFEPHFDNLGAKVFRHVTQRGGIPRASSPSEVAARNHELPAIRQPIGEPMIVRSSTSSWCPHGQPSSRHLFGPPTSAKTAWLAAACSSASGLGGMRKLGGWLALPADTECRARPSSDRDAGARDAHDGRRARLRAQVECLVNLFESLGLIDVGADGSYRRPPRSVTIALSLNTMNRHGPPGPSGLP